MFDSKFKESVAHVKKCSQIDDSLPVRYVSQMYDSKMSAKVSHTESVKNSMVREHKKKPLEEHSLEILVRKFLEKD